jgi:hypothetical protein
VPVYSLKLFDARAFTEMSASNRSLFALTVVFLLVLSSCVPKTPEVPTWEVELNLPLSEGRTTLAEVVEKTEELFVGGDSLLGFRFEQGVETIEVGESLRVDSFTEEVDTAYLGNMTIRPDEAETTGVGLTEIWPQAGNYQGQKVIIDEAFFPAINKVLHPYDYFDSLGIHSGVMRLTVVNDSTLQIVNLQLRVLDNVDLDTVGTVTVDTLKRGEEVTRQVVIVDDTLSDSFTIRLTADNFSSGGDSVTIDSASTIDVIVDFPSDLEVDFAKSRVAPQSFEKADSARFENLSIESAQIFSGSVSIEIENHLPIQSWLTLRLPNLQKGGKVVSRNFLLEAAVTDTVNIHLTGAQFSSSRPAPTGYLQVELADTTVDTDTVKVTLSNKDYISAQVRLGKLQLQSLTGILDTTRLELSPFTEKIDIPEGLTGIELQDPILRLDFHASGDFPVILDLRFLGTNQRGQTKALNLQDTLRFAGGEGVLTFDKDNSNLVEFLEIMPDSIELDLDQSSLLLGDGHTLIEVHSSDTLAGEVIIESPMWAVIAQTRFQGSEDEIERIEIEEKFTTELLSGEIRYTLYNHLPTGISRIDFYLSEDSASVYANPEVTIGPASMNPGIFDNTGRVITPDTTVGTVPLSRDQLDIFRNPNKNESKFIYLGYAVVIGGTGGEAVKIYQSDYLEHKLSATLRIKLKQDDFE